jgi:hypothetical protein
MPTAEAYGFGRPGWTPADVNEAPGLWRRSDPPVLSRGLHNEWRLCNAGKEAKLCREV